MFIKFINIANFDNIIIRKLKKFDLTFLLLWKAFNVY